MARLQGAATFGEPDPAGTSSGNILGRFRGFLSRSFENPGRQAASSMRVAGSTSLPVTKRCQLCLWQGCALGFLGLDPLLGLLLELGEAPPVFVHRRRMVIASSMADVAGGHWRPFLSSAGANGTTRGKDAR